MKFAKLYVKIPILTDSVNRLTESKESLTKKLTPVIND